MSQHDFNIANQGFPATRADINNAFQAIASNSSGPTAPSTTYANMWWYDTTNNKMYLRNEADSAWIEVATIDQTNNEWQITTGVVQAKDGDGLALKTDDGTTRLFIQDSDGAVGIGTSSPATALEVNGDITFGDGHTIGNDGGDNLKITSSTTESVVIQSGSGIHTWRDASDEYGRFDASGNLLVGKTSNDNTTAGIVLRPNGDLASVRDGGNPLLLNRLTSDGDIAVFRKDGTTVGSIGTNGAQLYIVGNDGAGIAIAGPSSALVPTDGSGNTSDNTKDVGSLLIRFDDIYATNGTIQTSDQNEKQQIASLTDAEITAAKAISKLFKTFKWNDSVAEKGDAARTHAGVIAQEVEQAMTDAGLNAGDYAFFISTTWWETQTEVPAVEADEENGVEAQEAYTRTDTYETAEEAPEGATERNRKGIRYPQLLSFIGAATEQRLASIESRLDALEA